MGPLGQNQFFCAVKDIFFAIHARYSPKASDQDLRFLPRKLSIGTARASLILHKQSSNWCLGCIEVVFSTQRVPRQNVQDGSLVKHYRKTVTEKPRWTGIGWKRERTFSWFHPPRSLFPTTPSSIGWYFRYDRRFCVGSFKNPNEVGLGLQ